MIEGRFCFCWAKHMTGIKKTRYHTHSTLQWHAKSVKVKKKYIFTDNNKSYKPSFSISMTEWTRLVDQWAWGKQLEDGIWSNSEHCDIISWDELKPMLIADILTKAKAILVHSQSLWTVCNVSEIKAKI